MSKKHNKRKPKGTMLFKYNEDDILEILSEYLAEANGYGTFSSKAIIHGIPGIDLRLIAVIGDVDDDLKEYSFEEIDKSMDFNGDHSCEAYKKNFISFADEGYNKE
jgi:hypothetical protein